MPCYSVLLIQKNRKKGEFLAFIYCSKMQKCLSFRGLRPLDPHQGSALDPLGGLQRPQTPSCVQQWPTVIASCACGATPDPVSGNNWVITKYASQFFKAGYGPALKTDLHTVVTIAEHASDYTPKRILRLSTHWLKIFLVKYGHIYTCDLYNYMKTNAYVKSLKYVFASICACDPYDYGDQAKSLVSICSKLHDHDTKNKASMWLSSHPFH